MPVHNLLLVNPVTRVNDLFVNDDSIDADSVQSPRRCSIVDSPPNSPATRYQADFFQKIACDLVVETVLDYPYPYITEKTLRPIACKRMFMVVGPCGILKLLKSKGFSTFDNIIDESYDNIENPADRLKKVISEAKKFCDRPLIEIVQYLTSNQHRLETNFQVLMHLQEQELKVLQSQLNDIN